jgi:hypothetical protein
MLRLKFTMKFNVCSVYDICNNEGWVSVGIDHDTASFAVATIRNWWNEMGKKKLKETSFILLRMVVEAIVQEADYGKRNYNYSLTIPV